MKFNKTAIRSISATLVLAQLSLAMQPLMAATREDKGASSPMAQAQLKQMQALQRSMDEGKAAQAAAALSPADRASTNLARVEELVRDLRYLGEEGDEAGAATKSGQEQVRAIGQTTKAKVRSLTAEQKLQRESRRTALWSELKSLLAQQGQDQGAVRSEFGQTRKMLIERKLPAVILARHDEAVAKFEQRVAQFNQAATKAASGDEAALAQLTAFFDENPTKRRAAPVDPKNLPWRTPEPTKRMPAETQTAWFQNLYGREGTRLAQAGNSLAGLTFITPPDAGSAPTEADLAETPETQRTAAIVAKATELGNNPVAIQNWVRNNVEWVPTWGAIQSAEDTLNKKRGNAIDIASLEIALLRAAKIPARYQFGTIELPAEQVMNWVGGVSKPEAAQQLLGQGGIANRGLIEGGKISKIRMEHAWVQAYVNWVPSRGAKQGSASQHPNPLAQRNAWVPLDASYKQYAFTSGLRLENAIATDADDLAASMTSASITEEGGRVVKDFNKSAAIAGFDAYFSKVQAAIAGAPSDAKARDIVGGKLVVPQASLVLSGGSQAPVVGSISTVARVPDGLKYKFVYKLYDSEYSRGMDEPLLNYVEATSGLVGRRLMLTYVPATPVDSETIAKFISDDVSGSSLNEAGFPKSMPAYLIKVVPVILLDGVRVAAGVSGVPMGSDLPAVGGFSRDGDAASWDLTNDDSHVAGQGTAIGISAAGVSTEQLSKLSGDVQSLVQRLTAKNFSGASFDSVSGRLLTAAMWAWFGRAEADSKIAQSVSGIVEYSGLSYGLFHSVVQPAYSWGVIRSVSFPGVNFDIGHLRAIQVAKNGSGAERVAYNVSRGYSMSALEHSVPESYFGKSDVCGGGVCGDGVSAVKVLARSAEAGQRVILLSAADYQADPQIVDRLMPNQSVGYRDRIRAALSSGWRVSAHESPVLIGSWRGGGYIAIDPENGSGAYIIEGGLNGGALAVIAGGLGGLVDSLTERLRNPDHMFGPADELRRSYWLKLAASATTLLTFVVAVAQIVDNDSLTPLEKSVQIAASFAITASANIFAAAVGAFFMNPLTGVVLAVGMAVLLALLNDWLNEKIVELL